MAVFVLQWQNWIDVTETIGSAKHKETPWPFTEHSFQSLFRGMMFSKPFPRVCILGLIMVCLNFRSCSTFRMVCFLFLLNQESLICRRPLKCYQVFDSWLWIFWSNMDSGSIEWVLNESNPQASLRCFHRRIDKSWKVKSM